LALCFAAVFGTVEPCLPGGKPARRTWVMNMDDYTIVSIYGAEYRE